MKLAVRRGSVTSQLEGNVAEPALWDAWSDLVTRMWSLDDGWAFGVAAADDRLVIDAGWFTLR